MFKYLIIILILFAKILFAGIIKHNNESEYAKYIHLSTKELASKVAKDTVSALRFPVEIDRITKLLSVVSVNNIILMQKSIDIKDKSIFSIWKNNKESIMQSMLDLESKQICHIIDWKYLIYKRGIFPQMRYISKNGEFLFELVITKNDCNNLQ